MDKRMLRALVGIPIVDDRSDPHRETIPESAPFKSARPVDSALGGGCRLLPDAKGQQEYVNVRPAVELLFDLEMFNLRQALDQPAPFPITRTAAQDVGKDRGDSGSSPRPAQSVLHEDRRAVDLTARPVAGIRCRHRGERRVHDEMCRALVGFVAQSAARPDFGKERAFKGPAIYSTLRGTLDGCEQQALAGGFEELGVEISSNEPRFPSPQRSTE